MIRTVSAFVELIGCRLPLQLAAMSGGIGTPSLAAAVAEAGGLGMIPGGSPSYVERSLRNVRRETDGLIGVNFLIPFLDRAAVEVAARYADAVEFFWADPDPDLVALAKREGALVAWQTGSPAEARAAEKAGCDFVVVQGVEAGGHVRGSQPLDVVLAEALDALNVPAVAAGGIGTAERVAWALRAGAAAVRVGARFVAATESAAHPIYLEALIAATRKETVLTQVFGADWPDAPHRVLRVALEAAERLHLDIAARLGDWEIPRFSSMPLGSSESRGPNGGARPGRGRGSGEDRPLESADGRHWQGDLLSTD
jgi:nitronate monooxygenase